VGGGAPPRGVGNRTPSFGGWERPPTRRACDRPDARPNEPLRSSSSPCEGAPLWRRASSGPQGSAPPGSCSHGAEELRRERARSFGPQDSRHYVSDRGRGNEPADWLIGGRDREPRASGSHAPPPTPEGSRGRTARLLQGALEDPPGVLGTQRALGAVRAGRQLHAGVAGRPGRPDRAGRDPARGPARHPGRPAPLNPRRARAQTARGVRVPGAQPPWATSA
jgi:hypothetical protein